LWEKIKTVLVWIGGALLAIIGYLFISKKYTKTDIATAKKELDEAQRQTDEVIKRITEAELVIKQAQRQTDEEVEHAKDIEVPNTPDGIANALNDVLARAHGGQGGGEGQQNCNGCAGRY